MSLRNRITEIERHLAPADAGDFLSRRRRAARELGEWERHTAQSAREAGIDAEAHRVECLEQIDGQRAREAGLSLAAYRRRMEEEGEA